MKKGENISGDITISVDQNKNMVTAALKFFEAPAIDLHDPQQVHDRIVDYFTTCTDRGLRPSNLGLYASLGLSRQDVADILRGANKSRVSPSSIDTLKRAKQALSTYREMLAMHGKINPVTAIFWGKNFDSMSDSMSIEVSRSSAFVQGSASMTPEQIREQIEKDIPVDADFTEDSTAQIVGG